VVSRPARRMLRSSERITVRFWVADRSSSRKTYRSDDVAVSALLPVPDRVAISSSMMLSVNSGRC
jgi:hypothetical protein